MKPGFLPRITLLCFLTAVCAHAQPASSKSPRSSPQSPFRAEIVTVDGNTVTLSGLHYVYTEQHDTGKYVNFPDYAQSVLDGMEHLPIQIFCGRLFVPFHLISRIEASGGRSGDDAKVKVRVFLKAGETIDGELGQTYGAALAGEGAFGDTSVPLEKITRATFFSEAGTSKTFNLPKGKPGGPFVISSGSHRISGVTLIDVGTFENRRNTLTALGKLTVGGMTVNVDFARLASITLTARAQEKNRVLGKDMHLELVLSSGERMQGPFVAGLNTEPGIAHDSNHSIIGRGSSGILLVSLFQPVTMTREGQSRAEGQSKAEASTQQNMESSGATARNYKGTEIKIVALERMKEFEFIKGFKLKADEGNEMVLVKLEVKWLGDGQDFKAECSKTNLVDVDGKKYECAGKTFFVHRGLPQYPTSDITIPFQVRKAAKLLAFEIEEVSLNLQSIGSAKTGD